MYLSVTSANCRTSPVSSSVSAWRIDFTKPPNSAPRTSSGTLEEFTASTAMPSRPMRLAASDPSTRSRRPASTSLNTPHLSLRHLAQPALQRRYLRVDPRRERLELVTHFAVAGIARQDVLVDMPCVFD